MRRFLALFFVFIILNASFVYADDNNLPSVNAQGAILMDMETGRVLFEKNSKAPMPMASTTKIMSAIITLENANLEDIVIVGKRATTAPKVKMYLTEKEEIRLKDLMYALMLQSSNDAAVAIAEHVGGSVENFCAMMTAKAKELGCEDTLFVTPNGLDEGDHHSTAYDLALIARYALQNEEFVDIINTQSVQFSSNKKSYSVNNKNRLLNEYSGAMGVKTGFTGKAGHCFVGAAKREDTTLISVVLASGWGTQGKNQKWVDTKKILDYGFNNIKHEKVINKGAYVTDIAVDRAKVDKFSVYFENDVIIPMLSNESFDIEYETADFAIAPIKKGDKFGTASVYINGDKVAQTNLIANEDIQRHDFATSVKKIIFEWINVAN